MKPIVILSVLRMTGCLNFYGTSYAFDVEGLGLGYNSIIAGLLEIVSFLILSKKLINLSRLYKSNSTTKRNRWFLFPCTVDGSCVLVLLCER